MGSAMSWNETEILAARREILKAAQDMLNGVRRGRAKNRCGWDDSTPR